MIKVALVISVFILGMFSFVIANAYTYLNQITNRIEDATLAGQWNLVGIQFIVGGFILGILLIANSRKR